MTKPTPEQVDTLLHSSPMPRNQIETMGRAYKSVSWFFWGNWMATKPGLTERQLYVLWRIAVWSWGAATDASKLPEWARDLGWVEPPPKESLAA